MSQAVDQLIKINRVKGKQNKKKWKKNIDVSGLLEHIEEKDNQQMKAKFQAPLVVEDTTDIKRKQLDPNRFKNRLRPQQKAKYDNSYKRQQLMGGEDDAWAIQIEKPKRKNTNPSSIPSIINPSTGHSYNPRQEDIDKIIDQVIDYEKPKPVRQKKIKKIIQRKIVPRMRNLRQRRQFLQAKERRKRKENQTQLHSIKKIKKQLLEKQKKKEQRVAHKVQKLRKATKQNKSGKVRQGPKLGKQRYHYKQYIPNENEINKKMSMVGHSEELMKDRFDSLFRRGMFEPRNVKVHANKTRNIKVTQQFREQ